MTIAELKEWMVLAAAIAFEQNPGESPRALADLLAAIRALPSTDLVMRLQPVIRGTIERALAKCTDYKPN